MSAHLDQAMWDPARIGGAWDHPPQTADDLRSAANVAEWAASSPVRGAWVDGIESRLVELGAAGFERAGVLTCGVGALTVACWSGKQAAAAKWWATPEEGRAATAAAVALADAGLGPAVLHIGEGLLITARVEPGVPLRCQPATWELLVPALTDLPAVAAALAEVQVPPVDGRRDAERLAARWRAAGLSEAAVANFDDVVTVLPAAPGHGDAQLGNVLDGGDRVVWIDAGPEAGGTLGDAARLLSHAWVDARAGGEPWNPVNGVEHAAELLGLDAGELALIVRHRAVRTWDYITTTVPSRSWESQAAAELANLLS